MTWKDPVTDLLIHAVNNSNGSEICGTCGAIIHLAGARHLDWDRKIRGLFDGTETFETLDEDPVGRIPDEIPVQNQWGRWLSVQELRSLLSTEKPAGSLESVLNEYGHQSLDRSPRNDPEGIYN